MTLIRVSDVNLLVWLFRAGGCRAMVGARWDLDYRILGVEQQVSLWRADVPAVPALLRGRESASNRALHCEGGIL